ncbi:MAG: hypothetical protein MUP45_04105 [Candidatus Marinimicrobia bacterium]|nr:hypothetical protein [Candidatus Neomarinimicrobiota bacterium]
MKILTFTEGTILMPLSALGLSRKERVEQSKRKEKKVYDFANHLPIEKAVKKLQTWKNQGVKIFYLTSRTLTTQIKDISNVLKKYQFPDSQNLLYRQKGEKYKDVAEKMMPNILIEDDCESIGGKKEMTYTYIKPKLKKKIKLIAVKEFGGIDHLPDKLEELLEH